MLTNGSARLQEERSRPLECSCEERTQGRPGSDIMSVSDGVASMLLTGGSDCSDA
jgi:hypothetical protein